MIDILNPTLESFARAGGLTPLTTADTYRGWSISYDPPPIPIRTFDWRATGPNYDASYEGPEDGWVASGGSVSASTRDGLIAEIDAWITEHCEVCDGHGSVLHAIDDGGPCPECGQAVEQCVDDDDDRPHDEIHRAIRGEA